MFSVEITFYQQIKITGKSLNNAKVYEIHTTFQAKTQLNTDFFRKITQILKKKLNKMPLYKKIDMKTLHIYLSSTLIYRSKHKLFDIQTQEKNT